ncbi:hypothetical protein Fot_37664 [Forsythia ovata]|uniref:Uncharacterized protein n=1 Tax=Forsythia ovata TaxID=205694 RepID=A0ABD1RZR0_9LAMI
MAEARAPTTSHSHPHIDMHNSKRYHLTDPLKDREHIPTKSTIVFDRLDDEADSYQRKPHVFERKMVGSISKDPCMCQIILMITKKMTRPDLLMKMMTTKTFISLIKLGVLPFLGVS